MKDNTVRNSIRYLLIALIFISMPSIRDLSLLAQANGTPETQAKAKLARHAHLFEYMKFGSPVEDRKPNANGEIDLSGGMLVDYAVDPNAPQKTANELLQLLAGRSSLVMRGTALGYHSDFNASRTFLYSDWQFKVLEVFKTPKHAYIAAGDTVTVARSGGAVKWNGRTVVAHDMTFPAFVAGEEYLLFLTSISDDPDSYRAAGWGSFLLSDNKVKYLIDPNDRHDDLAKATAQMTADSFVEAVKGSVQ